MGVRGILLFSPTVWAGLGGVEEGHTHTQEYTQERTRECCTYPLATYPLKSARKKKLASGLKLLCWFSSPKPEEKLVLKSLNPKISALLG